MQITLIRSVEQWLECGQIVDILDDAAMRTGYDNHEDQRTLHDATVKEFQGRVFDLLCDNGHDVAWAGQQNIGVGHICQNRFDHAKADRIVTAAIDECAVWLLHAATTDCTSEMESRPKEEA